MPKGKIISGRKILFHKDKDEIIRRLTRGDSLDKVEAWLKNKYKDARYKKRHVSRKTLQKFRQEYLGLDKLSLKQLQQQRAEIVAVQERKKVKTMLQKSEAYQEALIDVTDHKLDKEKRLKQFDKILETQISQMIQLTDEAVYSNDYNKISSASNILIKYIEQARGLIHDYHKIIDKEPDVRTEHFVNISMVQDELTGFRNAVIRVLRQMSPELQDVFLRALESEWANLKDDKGMSKEIVQNVDYQPVGADG